LSFCEITELKYTSLIKCIILEENFKWHLEALASKLFKWRWRPDHMWSCEWHNPCIIKYAYL